MATEERLPIPPGYSLDLVWDTKTEALRAEAARFWLEHGALPSQEAAERRSSELACIVRDSSGAIVGASTVYQNIHPRFGVRFYFFRCFVAREHRRAGLATALAVEVSRFLESRFRSGHDPEVIGVLIEVQNQELALAADQAVWPLVPFVYAGRNQRGDQERVFYFEGARLSNSR